MLKLPTCPYCNAIYRYGDVRKRTHQKNVKCYNCERQFRVFYIKGRLIVLLVAIVLMIIINLLIFNFLKGITILGCFVITAVFIGLAILIFPFTVKYKITEGKNPELCESKIRVSKES